MKKTLSIIIAGAVITTAALAYAARQSAASSPAGADENCKRCCPVSCESKADT
jgi:hypothetical protein